MKKQTLLFFCSMICIVVGFASNCAQFNPNNFNACVLCSQKYYLSNGKCLPCTQTTSSMTDCLPRPTNSEKNQNKTVSTTTAAAAPNKADQITANTSSTIISLNKGAEIVTTKETQNTVSKSDTVNKSSAFDSSTKKTNTEVIATDLNTPTSKTNGTNTGSQKMSQPNLSAKNTDIQTTQPKATPVVQKSLPSTGSLLQFLTQSDLANCAQFVIASQGIVCKSCKDQFMLNSEKVCVPYVPSETNISTLQKTSINNTRNVASDLRKTLDTRSTLLANDASSKIDQSQQQMIPSFLPSMSTSANSQNNPALTQSSIYPTLGTIYNLPGNNNGATVADNFSSQSTTTMAATRNIASSIQQSTSQQALAQQGVRFPSPNKSRDPNCLQVNLAFSLLLPISSQNKRCLKCYASNYYNIDLQVCTQINPKCRTADDQNNCLSCYPGFELSKGDCVVGGQSLSNILVTNKSPYLTPQLSSLYFVDPNCNKCAPNSNQCILCAINYYLFNGVCKQVNPLCRTYNRDNGNCLSCYQGYILDVSTQPISCSISKINNCRTYDRNNGNCLSCYSGYYLSEGNCKQYTTVQDPYCTRIGPKGCEQCIQRYYPDQNGACQMVSLLCASYNQSNGDCLSCILLYTLVNNQCVYQIRR